MKKQICKLLIFGTLTGILISGCGNARIKTDNSSAGNSAQVSDASLPEDVEESYTVNEDGTYTYRGVIYNYKLTLTGKPESAACPMTYTVLTNNKELTFDEVDTTLSSSIVEPGEAVFEVIDSSSEE